MNNTVKSLGSGLIGALAVNLINEGARRILPNAPRLDKVGQIGLAKAVRETGHTPPQGKNLYLWALAGDVVANTLYYGLVGTNKGKNAWQKGALLGLASGVSSLIFPRMFGAGQAVNRTPQTQGMTVAWYLIGGITAALVANALRKK